MVDPEEERPIDNLPAAVPLALWETDELERVASLSPK